MASSDSEHGRTSFPRSCSVLSAGSPHRTRGEKIEELLKTVATPAPEKLTYTKEDLAALGISLSFSSSPHIADEMRFFQPIGAADLARYNADEDWLEEDDEQLWENDRETYRLCMNVVHALQFRYDCLRRGKKGHRLADIYKWTPITIENSFFHRGEQMGHAPVSTPAGWLDTSLEEWIQPGGDETPEPHIRMITINSGVPDNNQLLVSELSAIVQVLNKRVHQPELQKTSRFPVLLISLSGPSNGRIIQALYDVEQDELTLTASELISLMEKDPPTLDLILRFMASKPQV